MQTLKHGRHPGLRLMGLQEIFWVGAIISYLGSLYNLYLARRRATLLSPVLHLLVHVDN